MGALHIDYRPENFNEIIGNKQTVESLKSVVKRDKADIPHAFLFYGPSGCGKTTFVRILSSEIGCPKTIDGKMNIDFQEINGRGIDAAKDIISNIHFKPFSSSCRVVMIDEAHHNTNDFQNAMLTTLEDSPPHVYFMLCTTEPKKIIPTIKNRCFRYKVNLLNDNELLQLLTWVISDIGRDIQDDVKNAIVEISDGCPRFALTTLDQIIDIPPNKMLESIAGSSFNDSDIREFCQAMLINDDWGSIAKILKGIKNHEPERIRQTVINYMKSVCLSGGRPRDKAALIFDCFRESNYHNGFAGIVFSAYNTTIE